MPPETGAVGRRGAHALCVLRWQDFFLSAFFSFVSDFPYFFSVLLVFNQFFFWCIGNGVMYPLCVLVAVAHVLGVLRLFVCVCYTSVCVCIRLCTCTCVL